MLAMIVVPSYPRARHVVTARRPSPFLRSSWASTIIGAA